MRPRSTAERIKRHLQRREKDRQRQARARAVLRRAIEALRRRYPEVTQERVAGQCGVDRSMVAKVWTGAATSNRVLITTIKAFVEAGWAPKREPVWARNARDLEVLAANLARTVLVEDREEDQLIPISRPAAP